MEKKTIIDLFESSVKRFPGNPFLWEKTGKRFEPTTYSKVRDLVYEEGAGLVSLGVRKGDNMALLSEGRNAWIIGELAMFYAGATNVPPASPTVCCAGSGTLPRSRATAPLPGKWRTTPFRLWRSTIWAWTRWTAGEDTEDAFMTSFLSRARAGAEPSRIRSP